MVNEQPKILSRRTQEIWCHFLRGSFSLSRGFEEFLDVSGFPRMPYVGGAAPRSQVTKGRRHQMSPRLQSPFPFIMRWASTQSSCLYFTVIYPVKF